MASLNIQRAIEEGYKIMNARYDLSRNAVDELISGSNKYDTVFNSFAVGYYQGYKAAMAEVKRKSRAAGEAAKNLTKPDIENTSKERINAMLDKIQEPAILIKIYAVVKTHYEILKEKRAAVEQVQKD